MKIMIEPVAVFPTLATNVVFDVIKVRVGESASAEYELRGESGLILTQGTAAISGEAYAKWGTDDSYIYDAMLEQLGLVKFVEPVVEEVPV